MAAVKHMPTDNQELFFVFQNSSGQLQIYRLRFLSLLLEQMNIFFQWIYSKLACCSSRYNRAIFLPWIYLFFVLILLNVYVQENYLGFQIMLGAAVLRSCFGEPQEMGAFQTLDGFWGLKISLSQILTMLQYALLFSSVLLLDYHAAAQSLFGVVLLVPWLIQALVHYYHHQVSYCVLSRNSLNHILKPSLPRCLVPAPLIRLKAISRQYNYFCSSMAELKDVILDAALNRMCSQYNFFRQPLLSCKLDTCLLLRYFKHFSTNIVTSQGVV